MNVTITTSGSNLTSRYGNPTFDCSGAQIRAHCRHLATVVTVQGEIDAVNVDRVSEYTRRFVLANNSLVLDLSGVNSFAAAGISLLYTIDEHCHAAEVEWTLVASDAVAERLREYEDDAVFAIARSVHEALHQFSDVIVERRRLLLPLIGKTA
jgi:anti-anti-sigma factor